MERKFNRIVICPTRALRDLFLRRICAGKTEYNYAVAFKDVNGWGLSLGKVDWLEPGQYHVSRAD